MNKISCDLKSVETAGEMTAKFRAGGLWMTAASQNTSFHVYGQPLFSYARVPGRYKLPLRIDLTVNIVVPGFYLIFGNGHLSFATRMDNRSIGDIWDPDCKKPRSFANSVALNRDAHICVIYGLKFMQILVDGETRYFSKREKYMRAQEFLERNSAGFEIGLAPDKQASILIKEISCVEYETDPEAIPYINEITPPILANSKDVKADFAECISGLSGEIQNELFTLDAYLLEQKDLKLKRKIEGDHKGCKITYVSPLGFSYSLMISNELLDHFFWWYMVSNYKYNNQYMGRKNDLTDEMLSLADALSPETASRIAGYFRPCTACTPGCQARTTYHFKNKQISACHGKLFFNMNLQTFRDVRFLFDILRKIQLT